MGLIMGIMTIPHKAVRAGDSSVCICSCFIAYFFLMQQLQPCTFLPVLDPKWKQCISVQWLNQSSAIFLRHLLRSIFGKK